MVLLHVQMALGKLRVSHDNVSRIIKRDNMHKRAISENDHVLFRQYRSLRNQITNKICSKMKEFFICSSNSFKKLWLVVSVAMGKTYTLIMYPVILPVIFL